MAKHLHLLSWGLLLGFKENIHLKFQGHLKGITPKLRKSGGSTELLKESSPKDLRWEKNLGKITSPIPGIADRFFSLSMAREFYFPEATFLRNESFKKKPLTKVWFIELKT